MSVENVPRVALVFRRACVLIVTTDTSLHCLVTQRNICPALYSTYTLLLYSTFTLLLFFLLFLFSSFPFFFFLPRVQLLCQQQHATSCLGINPSAFAAAAAAAAAVVAVAVAVAVPAALLGQERELPRRHQTEQRCSVCRPYDLLPLVVGQPLGEPIRAERQSSEVSDNAAP